MKRDGEKVGAAHAPTVAATDPTTPDAADQAQSSSGRSIGLDPVVTRYRLGAVIGRGGMGEVVSARDDQIGRSVAIKRMLSADAPPQAIARFMREARIQGRLEHPAIVPVHEVRHDESGRPFFVMKQLTGITLDEILSRQVAGDLEITRRFTRQVLLRAFVDVCLAIAFAHTRGVIHRDLKPANIMLGDFGEVYVLDWGIARVVEDDAARDEARDGDTNVDTEEPETSAGAVLGTPGFMAPEQVHGEALDHRADVYALGCILFNVLTLQSLHPAGRAGLASAVAGVDARPSARVPDRDLPPELDAACVAATATDRRDRLGSTRELADAVQRYLDGDRDLVLRSKLARAELDTAHAARSKDDRRLAIRAAVRALALDPSSLEAAELVGTLMLEPPTEIPAEVERELESLDDDSMRVQGRLGTVSMLTYMLFFPLMYWAGFRDLWYMIAGPAVTAVIVISSYVVSRTASRQVAYVCFVANVLLVAIFSRITTPFLIAPGIGAVTVITYAAQARMGRAWVLFGVMLLAVLGPWVAELTGLLSRTTVVAGGSFHLHTASTHLHPTLTMLALVLSVSAVLAMSAILPRTLSLSRRDMQRSLQVQAWQLRQLIPHATLSSR